MSKWVLDDALQLVRGLQDSIAKFGYQAGLAGTVLNAGASDKTVQILFMPIEQYTTGKPEELWEFLVKLWGAPSKVGSAVNIEASPDQVRTALANPFRVPQPRNYSDFVEVDIEAQRQRVEELQFIERAAHPGRGWEPAPPKPPIYVSPYKHKAQFVRSGGDMITVFIV